MSSFPLFRHASLDRVIAYRAGVAIQARRFLEDVSHVSATLPAGGHVLNVCTDRYRFTVGLAAALVSRKISVLPATHTPAAIRELGTFATDLFCLTDDAQCDIDLPQILYREGAHDADQPLEVPQLDGAQVAAYIFTSGSTGTSLPYRKTWGRLVSCIRGGAERLQIIDGRSYAIVSTVPAQHMYGFESSVLLALQSGNALCAERPFYPADICAAIAAVPRPRVLVTTPIHLRTLLAAEVDMPALDLVVSATAPLSQNLAREVEQRFDTRLLEIYGSTETGQIAMRRTAQQVEWDLYPQVRLTTDGEQIWADGGHVEQLTRLCDVIELTAGRRFLLHGRTADQVNIGGKRSSIAYLNHLLNGIDGVVDGTFFIRDEQVSSPMGIARLAAIVVAPGLSAAELTRQLRERIDAVFLPRPLIFVDRLPRNATGKLPHEALQTIVTQHLPYA